MGIKRGLAKIAPKAISDKAIDKGEHNGDDWATVSVVAMRMCEARLANESTMDLYYNDKKVGFAKADGTSWFDDNAYDEVKAAFNALPEEDKAECMQQMESIRQMAASGAIPSSPRQVRQQKARAQAVEGEFGAIESGDEGSIPDYTDC